MNEATFQRQVINMAQLFGWKVSHFRPAMTSKGWRTPVSADGQGWPDLVLVRERVLFRELKTDKGKATRHQLAWIEALDAAGQDAAVWRPRDWDSIEAELRRLF